jgi:carbamoyltransferase
LRKYPTVVGLNLGHDGGCAIISDGKIVAIAEERLNRTRYSRGWQASLLYCLQAAGRRVEDVDLFALSCVGPHLPQGFVTGLASLSVHSQRVIQVDHHLSHAYGAFCLSGFNDAVVVVVDGTGNGNDTER